MTVTPYVDMCNMDFIQFHSRKDNTEKKLSESSNLTCINICYAIIVVGSVFCFVLTSIHFILGAPKFAEQLNEAMSTHVRK
jgi:hypothetical protein